MIDLTRVLAEHHEPGRGRIPMAGSKINLVTRMIAAHSARYIEKLLLTLERQPWILWTFPRSSHVCEDAYRSAFDRVFRVSFSPWIQNALLWQETHPSSICLLGHHV